MKKTLLQFLITFFVGCVLMVSMFYLRRGSDHSAANVTRYLSDSALLPAVLIGGFGVLVFCTRGGTFDMLSYGIKRMFTFFKRNKDKDQDPETYYDYRERHSQKTAKYKHFLIAGAFFLILAIIFMLVYLL